MGVQGSLFGHEPVGFDGSFRRLVRYDLGNDAWIEHDDGFLDGHERLMSELGHQTRWREDHLYVNGQDVPLPRLVAHVPDDLDPHPTLTALQQALSARYETELHHVSLSLYRNGEDSVSWHGDRGARELSASLMVTLSLGNPRPFQLRPAGKGAKRRKPITLQLGWGDLLVMGGSIQRTWEHRVPKRPHADPRLVVMFRQRYGA